MAWLGGLGRAMDRLSLLVDLVIFFATRAGFLCFLVVLGVI